MKTVKLGWSGLLGYLGRAAMHEAARMGDVEIVVGIEHRLRQGTGIGPTNHLLEPGQRVDDTSSPWPALASVETDFSSVRWYHYNDLNHNYERFSDVDVLVEVIRPQEFGRILELATHAQKPLIVDTSDLTTRQLEQLRDATHTIPVMQFADFDGTDEELVCTILEGAKRLKQLESRPLRPYEFYKLE